ncbi:phosphate transport system substrate-binding protein [Methanomicrobium sp. W14]|uniref:phosphate ABC transporter substrate-binding protein n=1 Tax=Methanomicrobium sp. W14 TaxID=2817839 RepID=UPI001AEB8426|nr:phosphate ABC transporter substrate-binding protein [Methanomicrobium sp. W14]MBP2132732.1 phosphate transport system substrate-binding protein [Methanomicrobium sp. W14]
MNSGKKFGLTTVALAAVVVFAVFICGCTGEGSSSATPSSTTGATNAVSGTLTVTGSTTVLPIAQASAEEYMSENQNVDVQVSGGGSSVGVQAVGEGTADIGMASRELKDSEKKLYPNLVRHVIARDGIALVVYPGNTVSDITLDSIKKIYTGEITNWKELGGDDMTIVVVGRDSSSGTREFFSEKIMGEDDFVSTMLEKNSNGAVAQTVAQTPGAIGYLSMGYLDGSVKALNINEDGTIIKANIDNVLNGTYPIARGLNMFTNGEATGLAKDYIDFILGSKGQAIVTKEGYVTVA